MEKLRSHTSTFTSVAKDFNVSVQTVVNVFDNYASSSRLPLDEAICIDEIYTNKLTKKKYSCVIMNFKTKQVIDLYPSRLKYDLEDNFMSIPLEERKQVKYVIIDMWDTYKQVSLGVFPNAIVAVDSFHVIKHLNLAIDMIRLKVMRKYDKGHSKLENAEMYYYMLKKFHYFFTKNYDNIYDGKIKVHKLHTSWDKHEIRKYLLEIDTDLNYAYNLKQEYQEFNLTAKYKTCDEELDKLINDFRTSHLKEFREFGKLLNHWRTEIKNSFIKIDAYTTDKKTNEIISIKKRLSNGPMEGGNSRIKCIIKNANGYKNFDRFRKRVLFSINKNTPIRSNNKSKDKDNDNKNKDK
jgi:transposase